MIGDAENSAQHHRNKLDIKIYLNCKPAFLNSSNISEYHRYVSVYLIR